MKNFITICMAFLFLGAEAQTTNKKEKISRKYVIGVGTILHIQKENLENYFFVLEEESDTTGELLNEDYPIVGKNFKITSGGPDFIVIRKNKQSGKYQYNFKTKSWYFDKPKSPNWSTGNREDP